MPETKPATSEACADPDYAPELTDEMMADAEVFEGDTFVRRLGAAPPGNIDAFAQGGGFEVPGG